MTSEHESHEADEAQQEPSSPRFGTGPLRGTGSSTRGGGLAAEIWRRAEAASQAAAGAADAAKPQARELADQVQRLASAARDEAARQRPAAERAARAAGSGMRDAVERAKPEVERLARDARAAGAAAAPHVQRAAQGAASYAREHESELRGAATQAARSAVPGPLKPAVDALGRESAKAEPGTEGNGAAEDQPPSAPGGSGPEERP